MKIAADTFLRIGAIVEIILGAMHMPMAFFPPENLPIVLPGYIDNMLTLAIFAIGLLLLSVGSMSLIALKHGAETIVKYFILVQIVLWIGRFLLELSYPVQLPQPGIENPALLVLIIVSLELCIFLLAGILLMKKNNE